MKQSSDVPQRVQTMKQLPVVPSHVVQRSLPAPGRGIPSRSMKQSLGASPLCNSLVGSIDRNLNELVAPHVVDGGWERIPVTIDSGAIDTVMPRQSANHVPLIETEASKHGPGFRAANGSPIRHFGQRSVRGLGDSFQPVGLVAQVADVKTTLASVKQMLKAGNRVHFESGNCYIEHVASGRVTEMIERDGTYEIGVWVPRVRQVKSVKPAVAVSNRFDALSAPADAMPESCVKTRGAPVDPPADAGGVGSSGFVRQDEHY